MDTCPRSASLVAEGLGIPISKVDGVVSFYSFFTSTPQGKYKIGVCMGTACYVKGSAQVLEELEKQLGVKVSETSADGLFTLEVTGVSVPAVYSGNYHR